MRRRVRRHGKNSTGTAYVISSLPLEQLDARGVLQLKRGYGVVESKLHHALDVSLAVDRSRVRHPKAALVPGLFRRLVISVANAAIVQVQTKKRAGACNAISSNLGIEKTDPNGCAHWLSPKTPLPGSCTHEKRRAVSRQNFATFSNFLLTKSVHHSFSRRHQHSETHGTKLHGVFRRSQGRGVFNP